MKRIKMCLLVIGIIMSLSNYAFAKATPPEIGSVRKYVSENGIYSVSIKILGYPDQSPAECTFKEGNKIIWSKKITNTPGIVEISNNGKFIVLANYGWYDEGGFKSLSFYNNEGNLLREISFGNKGKDSMKWIRNTAISSEGKYYAFSTAGKEKAQLYLYGVESAKLLWQKECGFERSVEIEISDKTILFATFSSQTGDMLFVLSTMNGDVLWDKKIEKNHFWNIEDYLHFSDRGRSFKIFNKADEAYISFMIENGKVIQK